MLKALINRSHVWARILVSWAGWAVGFDTKESRNFTTQGVVQDVHHAEHSCNACCDPRRNCDVQYAIIKAYRHLHTTKHAPYTCEQVGWQLYRQRAVTDRPASLQTNLAVLRAGNKTCFVVYQAVQAFGFSKGSSRWRVNKRQPMAGPKAACQKAAADSMSKAAANGMYKGSSQWHVQRQQPMAIQTATANSMPKGSGRWQVR